MWPNGGDNKNVVRALFMYDSDDTGVVHVLCSNDGNNTHAVYARMEELIILHMHMLTCNIISIFLITHHVELELIIYYYS